MIVKVKYEVFVPDTENQGNYTEERLFTVRKWWSDQRIRKRFMRRAMRENLDILSFEFERVDQL